MIGRFVRELASIACAKVSSRSNVRSGPNKRSESDVRSRPNLANLEPISTVNLMYPSGPYVRSGPKVRSGWI